MDLANCMPAGRQLGVTRGRPRPALHRRRRAPHAGVSAQSRSIGPRSPAVAVTVFAHLAWRARPAAVWTPIGDRLRLARPLQPAAICSPAREGPMTTSLELVGAFLLAATLLTVAMFLVASQLGHLIMRDDEQREVGVARTPEMAVHNLAMTRACSRTARSSTSTRPTAAPRGGVSARRASSPSSISRWSRRSTTASP